MSTNGPSKSIEARFDATGKKLNTGNLETIKITANINEVSPQTKEFLVLAEQLIRSSNRIVEWLAHGDTVTPGKSAGVRTSSGITVPVIINVEGKLQNFDAVNIYVPRSTRDNLYTALHVTGNNNLRLIGHLNGRETDAIILDKNVTVHLISDLVTNTTRVIGTELIGSSEFTAYIYESTSVPTVHFTAEIYEPVVFFTAVIYEIEDP